MLRRNDFRTINEFFVFANENYKGAIILNSFDWSIDREINWSLIHSKFLSYLNRNQ